MSLLEEIFDLEKRNHSTKLCFYFTRALTFDSFYMTSVIILVKTMLDLKTGNNFLLDAAWIYTTLLYMAMHTLNDWLLIYHKIKKVSFLFIESIVQQTYNVMFVNVFFSSFFLQTENSVQQLHIAHLNSFINILSVIFLFESTILYLLMPSNLTPFCWSFMHVFLGANSMYNLKNNGFAYAAYQFVIFIINFSFDEWMQTW